MTGSNGNGELNVFPRGWFCVGTSSDIKQGETTGLQYFGKKYVAYRNKADEVVILDGICPHMGADLAVGGCIQEDGIVCPFHAWRFNQEGICDDIPYAKVIPPRAKIDAHLVDEKNGLIFMWHDSEGGAPDYELPNQQAFDNPDWTTWEFINKEIPTHPREIVDNIADKGHFGPVHGTRVQTFENEFTEHYAIQRMTFKPGRDLLTHDGGDAIQMSEEFAEKMESLGRSDLEMDEDTITDSHAQYHGPGYLLNQLKGNLNQVLLICHTPIRDGEVRVWAGSMVDLSDYNHDPKLAELIETASGAAVYGILQDVFLWENKAKIDNPILCDGDGNINKAREWYQNFYTSRMQSKAAAE